MLEEVGVPAPALLDFVAAPRPDHGHVRDLARRARVDQVGPEPVVELDQLVVERKDALLPRTAAGRHGDEGHEPDPDKRSHGDALPFWWWTVNVVDKIRSSTRPYNSSRKRLGQGQGQAQAQGEGYAGFVTARPFPACAGSPATRLTPQPYQARHAGLRRASPRHGPGRKRQA